MTRQCSKGGDLHCGKSLSGIATPFAHSYYDVVPSYSIEPT